MASRFTMAISMVGMLFLVPLCYTLAPVCPVSSDDPHVPCCLEWLIILNPQLEILNLNFELELLMVSSWHMYWN